MSKLEPHNLLWDVKSLIVGSRARVARSVNSELVLLSLSRQCLDN